MRAWRGLGWLGEGTGSRSAARQCPLSFSAMMMPLAALATTPRSQYPASTYPRHVYALVDDVLVAVRVCMLRLWVKDS